MSNELFCEYAYNSLIKDQEELCGDSVEIVNNKRTKIFVLADGLGSGVKASILSTLTAKMLSTMLMNNVDLQESVETVIDTLPVCKERNVAYSTFTILNVKDDKILEIIQYDNPKTLMFRNGKIFLYETKAIMIKNHRCTYAKISLQERDTFIAMSDGCINASSGIVLNLNWNEKTISEFIAPFTGLFFPARSINKILLDEIKNLYCNKPLDDVTAITLYFKEKVKVNLLFGPSKDQDKTKEMLDTFIKQPGIHIVSGGTTSKIVANYLKKTLVPLNKIYDKEIPPISKIEGIDLVTEGVVTMSRVVDNLNNYLQDTPDNPSYFINKDGASLITRILIEKATDINIYCGTAINPAHQNPDLNININIKIHLVRQLQEQLKKINKTVNLKFY